MRSPRNKILLLRCFTRVISVHMCNVRIKVRSKRVPKFHPTVVAVDSQKVVASF